MRRCEKPKKRVRLPYLNLSNPTLCIIRVCARGRLEVHLALTQNYESSILSGHTMNKENDGTIVIATVIASLAIGAAAVMWKLFDQKRK